VRTNITLGHPDDAKLLAFLDGELSMSEAHAVKMHMNRCWKCRTVLADLESQVEHVSRLLSAGSDDDKCHSAQAKTQFLEWKKAFEKKKANFRLWLFDFSVSLLAATGRMRNSGKPGGYLESHLGRNLAAEQNLQAAYEV